MIAHVTIGAQHVLLRDPEPGAAWRCLADSADCTTCGDDLAAGGQIARPSRRDARAGLRLVCTGCATSWPIRRGDPLEVQP